jgi:hypothetical protein
MTKREILRKRLGALGLRLEPRIPPRFVEDPQGNWFTRWIIRPDTIGSCMAKEVIPLRRLADAEDVVDRLALASGC